MRVWIDQDLCTGDGLCVDHCPDVFVQLEDGIAYVSQSGQVLNDPGSSGSLAWVSPRHVRMVIHAAEVCPGRVHLHRARRPDRRRRRGRRLTSAFMQTRKIGVLDVSVVGLGCNNFGMMIDAERTRAVVDAAIDAGINYFDTAESYGRGQSEEFLGAALAGRRADVLIATKWGHTIGLAEGERDGDPARIRRSLEASLQRLGTDYVDHYQLHRPDPNTPQEDTLGALEELRAEGKIREIGCTYFSAGELADARAGRRRDRRAELSVGPEPVQPADPRARDRRGARRVPAVGDRVRAVLPARVRAC